MKKQQKCNATPVGYKQLQVANALLNAYRMLRCKKDTYLQDSAAFIRERLPDYSGEVDRSIKLLLDRNHLCYVPTDEVGASHNLYLQVGIFYCTKGFADLFFSEYLLNDFRVEPTRHRLVIHYLRSGCRCAELLPNKSISFWLQLAEKIVLISSGEASQSNAA